MDVTNAPQVEQSIVDYKPSVVLNATAYNRVDIAETEPEAAFAGNGLAVRNMAVSCRQSGARLVHFSTDYVFDGLAGRSYTEEDATHPLSAYGVSKLAGELFAQAYLEDALIIRTSGVFGTAGLNTARGNFVETMLRRANRTDPIRVVEDYVASPTFAPLLAERTADLVQTNQHGIFHVGGGTAISWYDFARMIFAEAGIEPELLPTNGREHRTPAKRPPYSALSNKKMEQQGVHAMPKLRDCLRTYLKARKSVLSSHR